MVLLTVRAAAAALSVTPDTVRKYIRDGRIEARRLPGGNYRIPEEEVAAVQRSVDQAPQVERSMQSSTQN